MDGLPPPTGQPATTSAPARNAGRGILIVGSALVVLAIIGATVERGDNGDEIDPIVTDRIDALEADRDCRGLQSQFDIADRNRTTPIMEYADDAMRDAGCYD